MRRSGFVLLSMMDMVVSRRGSSNDVGSARTCVLRRRRGVSIEGKAEEERKGTHESNTPNERGTGKLVWSSSSGTLIFREHVVRPVSSSYVAFGSWAGEMGVMSALVIPFRGQDKRGRTPVHNPRMHAAGGRTGKVEETKETDDDVLFLKASTIAISAASNAFPS